jgi:hypothetical protein
VIQAIRQRSNVTANQVAHVLLTNGKPKNKTKKNTNALVQRK